MRRALMLWMLVSCAQRSLPSGPDPTTETSGHTGQTGSTGSTGSIGFNGNTSTEPGLGPIDVTGATGSSAPPQEPTPEQVFSAAITGVTVEVDYMTNAAPYTGNVGLHSDVWALFRDNVDTLFDATKTLTAPNTLAQMEHLSSVTGTDFTVSTILDIAAAHRQTQSSGAVASYYFVFLDGYFHNGQARMTNVLGVSLGRTAVIAMFKPVIASTKNFLNPDVEKYVEQAVLVHEFGHAVGLVNNGLPMAQPHEDTAHGAHCSNTSCGMYYMNESPSALASFVTAYLQTQSPIWFDAACLADAQAALAR